MVTRCHGGDGTDIGAVELPASSVAGIGFNVTIGRRALGGRKRPLLAGHSTPVTCYVNVGTISSCIVKVRFHGKLVASGSSVTAHPRHRLSLRVNLTSNGSVLLARRPLGVNADVTALASAPGTPSVRGKVHLLGGPHLTLSGLGRSHRLPPRVLRELDQIAKLLGGVKRVNCTAYTRGRGGASIATGQARAACHRLKHDRLKARYRIAGRSSRGKSRLVISFRF